MKFFVLVIFIILHFPALAQEASYMHDGDYHFYIDGAQVSAPAIVLEDEIMFEYDAKVYLVKNTAAAENAGKKISGEMFNDRTTLKAWGIDFYVERNGVVILYVNGNFHYADSLFLAAGEVIGYIEPYYFRLGNFNEREENVVGEIVVLPDGIWWNDGGGQLFALRNGEPFNSSAQPFLKGYLAADEATNEYIWFDRHSDQTEPRVYLMEVIPELIAINVFYGKSFVAQVVYKGRPLGESSVDLEMDEDPSTSINKSIYFFDPDINKAFWGKYPDYGQTMDLTEIAVPKVKDMTFWLTDNTGQYYLQDKSDIWRVETSSSQGRHIALYEGRKYELLEREMAKSLELHPTRVIE